MNRFLHSTLVALFIVAALGGAHRAYGQDFFVGGQRPRFNEITGADGLPSNSISSVFQDRRGLMWFGTQSGLTRYDGQSFVSYHNVPFETDSLPHDLVQTVYYDEDADTIWVGTYGGLAALHPGAAGFETYLHDPGDRSSLSDNVVIAIAQGPAGALWVGTQNGLNRMNDDGSFQRVESRNPVIRDLFLDSEGTLWVASLAGLDRWDPQSESLVPMEQLESPYVMAIDEIEPGVLALATWELDGNIGGLVAYREDQGELWRRRFSTNSLYSVLVGSDGTIWTGSWGGGLFAVTPDDEVYEFTPETEELLNDPVIYALYEDAGGLVWVGTNGGGLHVLSPRQRNYRAYYHNPDVPGTLPAGRVTQIQRDAQGTLWVGTYGGGLARLDAGSDRWQTYRAASETDAPGGSADPETLLNDIVNVVWEDRDGSIWVGTNGGLQRLDPETDRFETWIEVYPEAPLAGDIVYSVIRDRDGRYWVGTYRFGITRYDPATGAVAAFSTATGASHQIANDLIYDILEDRSGTIWIATNGGVSRYFPDRDETRTYRYSPENRDGLSSNTVRAIFEDGDGRIWLATLGGGINRFVPETESFEHITMEDGLPTNKIVSLLQGHGGKIWTGTQNGLVAYAPDSGTISVIDERDGLFGSEFNMGALRDRSGELFFGGAHGITRIDSSVESRNTTPPSVQIIDVTVFQESVDPNRLSFNGASLEVDADASFIGFSFAALDYEAVSGNTYRYRLNGFDEDWVEAGTRGYARYTNLGPGTYRLEVHAANADGVWSTEPATLDLQVRAAWYARWWAVTLYAAAAVLFVYSLIRTRDARILGQQNDRLEHLVSQLALANDELERLSIRDALTGCFNRRYFDATLTDEWNRARRAEAPIALLMIDIDHFKPFNDTHGHVVGDAALAAVAGVMTDQMNRSTDFVARYGGEEFAAVLYETDTEGARRVAERMREAVASTTPGEGLPAVTVSIGVAGLVPGDGNPRQLVEYADTALYAAKDAGRNCVVVYGIGVQPDTA